jgi:hypothetical protein
MWKAAKIQKVGELQSACLGALVAPCFQQKPVSDRRSRAKALPQLNLNISSRSRRH